MDSYLELIGARNPQTRALQLGPLAVITLLAAGLLFYFTEDRYAFIALLA